MIDFFTKWRNIIFNNSKILSKIKINEIRVMKRLRYSIIVITLPLFFIGCATPYVVETRKPTDH